MTLKVDGPQQQPLRLQWTRTLDPGEDRKRSRPFISILMFNVNFYRSSVSARYTWFVSITQQLLPVIMTSSCTAHSSCSPSPISQPLKDQVSGLRSPFHQWMSISVRLSCHFNSRLHAIVLGSVYSCWTETLSITFPWLHVAAAPESCSSFLVTPRKEPHG